MKIYKALRKELRDCARRLREALTKASDACCDLVLDLNSEFASEYALQLQERGQAENPFMPSLCVSEEGDGFEGTGSGVYYPRWCVAHKYEDGHADLYEYPIDVDCVGANHTFEDLERQLCDLQAWELLLVWKYEQRVKPLRESIRGLEDLIDQLFARSNYPLVDKLPAVDDIVINRKSA